MATKADLQEEVNEKLDTDIEWSNLTKNDLQDFHEMLDDEGFIKTVIAQYANKATGNKVEGGIKDWRPGQFFAIAKSDDMSLTDILMRF